MTTQANTNGGGEPGSKPNATYLYAIVLVATVGGFLFGYDLAIICPAIIFLTPEFQLSSFGIGVVMGSATLGCPVGPLAGVGIANRLGRKWAMVLAAVLFMASAIGCALAGGMMSFFIWRFVGGMGVGLASAVSPMYIAEVAPARLRGRLVLMNQLTNVVGIMIAALVAYLLSFGGHWRWMFASQVVPVLGLATGLLFVPESPRWLAMIGKPQAALRVLARISGRSQAEREMADIQAELHEESGGFAELLRPGVRVALILGIVLMIFAQINGANPILGYAALILQKAGVSSPSAAILNQFYVFGWIAICTLVAFWLTHRYTRRSILIVGALGIAFGHSLMFLSYLYRWSPQVMLLVMLVPTGAYVLTLAPLGWVVVAEIFPNRVRATAISLTTSVMFVCTYVVTSTFPVLTGWFTDQFGQPGGLYLVFAGACLLCALFVWGMLPETKDKTLEEIGEFWLSRDRAS